MSYSGGMFSDDGFRALFVTVLQGQPANYDLRLPLLDPALGAALYAAKHRGQPLSSDAVRQLAVTATTFDEVKTP